MESIDSKKDVSWGVERHTGTAEDETLKTLRGVNGRENIRQVTVCEKPSQVILDRPTYDMTRHLCTPYTTAQIDENLVSRALVDNGASINIMPLSMLKLGRNEIDLILVDDVMTNFTREKAKLIGVLLADITIGGSTTMSAFFVMQTASNYRDWIHAYSCVPSSSY